MALALTILSLFCVILACAHADGNNAGGKARSCSDARRFYSGKGFTLNGVPHAEMSGKNNGAGVGAAGFTVCGLRLLHINTHLSGSAPAGRHGDVLAAYYRIK
ncbi:glypican-1 [Tachysurus ichikawai]